ncbi:MAG TPA: family 10 glycosylhydrolase [bacterium]|nr:family 10 glycosylhydrolase [bacterium]
MVVNLEKTLTRLLPVPMALLLVGLLASPAAVEQGATSALAKRAVWVTRWACKSPQDVTALFSSLAELGVNTVFFQVRGAGDAFYKSSLEPWSEVLTGTLGKDPGWDPLEVAITEGHRLGLEVHAWVNVFTAWPTNDAGEPPPVTQPMHVFRAHPEWLVCDRMRKPMSIKKSEARDNYAFLSPTSKGARDYVKKVLREIVLKYEVDGLHLDYVRFPDSCYSYDRESRLAYLKDTLHKEIPYSEWRRQKLTEFVADLSRSVKKIRPRAKLSAAVMQTIDTGRNIYFQDGVEWARRGYVDFLVPMIYTPNLSFFGTRLEAYADSVGASRVVVGIGAYLEGFSDSTLVAELRTAMAWHVQGISIFNSDYVLQHASVLPSYLGAR